MAFDNPAADINRSISARQTVHRNQARGGADQSGFVNQAGAFGGTDDTLRGENAEQAAQNFYRRLPGGARSTDAYEAAQQDRNMYLDPTRMKYADARSPAQLLQDRLGTGAYNFRRSLAETQANAADDIKSQAGSTLDQGLRDVRSGANNRGLLYSGLRQGAEQDYRGKVASTMAKQVAQSNADLSKRADSMDEIAANAKLQGMQQSMQAQAQVDRMAQENAVMRAQQMQQLTGAVGYGFGRWAGGGRDDESNPPGTSRAY